MPSLLSLLFSRVAPSLKYPLGTRFLNHVVLPIPWGPFNTKVPSIGFDSLTLKSVTRFRATTLISHLRTRVLYRLSILCLFSARSMCRSEEHTSELQSRQYLVCRLLLEKKK